MVIETMTFKEVYREIEADHDNLERWWVHRQREVERMARKQTRFPWCKWHEYMSPRRNRYLILTESPTRHYMKHGIMGVIALRRVQNGIEVFYTGIRRDSVVTPMVVLPHAFRRYAERTGQQLTGVDCIKTFCQRNSTGTGTWNNKAVGRSVRYNGKEHLSMCIKEGVLLGQAEDGIYVVRTFITYEMATGRQQEEFNDRRSRILTTQETEQLIRLRRWEMEQEIKRITPDFLPSS